MNIVVIGGSGLIGSKVVNQLRGHGHEATAASPDSGVDTLTGEGLDAALEGASVVIDVSNSPSFEDAAVMEFFKTSTGNLLAAEAAAGVAHHVALSVVGTERLTESGYFRAKLAQEAIIKEAGVPYTIVRATQFCEFLDAIAGAGTVDGKVRLPGAGFQPIAAADVAAVVAEVAQAAPTDATIDIAGPERLPFCELIARYLKAIGDPREVVRDPEARYFGARLEEGSLVPAGAARLGPTSLEEWIRTRAR
jgi:uncharacterized protein YbjT (DUF2867 family)